MDEFDPPLAQPRSWRLWDCRTPLGRSAYLVVGVGLMVLKYGVEAAAIKSATGLTYTPLDFLNPLMSARQQFVRGAPDWFGIAWIVWTLPFVVIAVTLTQRRAIDAGLSPWWGLAILIPLVNLAVMVILSILPTRSSGVSNDSGGTNIQTAADTSSVSATFVGVAIAAVYAVGISLVCIYGFDSYGSALFFGVPLVSGAAAAFQFNRLRPRGWLETLCVAMLPMLCLGCVFLMFALEGLICIAMAVPIMLPLAVVGGIIGKNIASLQEAHRSRGRQLAGCLIALPIIAFGESRLPQRAEYCVESSVESRRRPRNSGRM